MEINETLKEIANNSIVYCDCNPPLNKEHFIEWYKEDNFISLMNTALKDYCEIIKLINYNWKTLKHKDNEEDIKNMFLQNVCEIIKHNIPSLREYDPQEDLLKELHKI